MIIPVKKHKQHHIGSYLGEVHIDFGAIFLGIRSVEFLHK